MGGKDVECRRGSSMNRAGGGGDGGAKGFVDRSCYCMFVEGNSGRREETVIAAMSLGR